MSTPAAAHLHVHSEYSLLDGAASIDGLAARAAAFGQPALGLTDHGVMNGSVELYKACKKHGVKPILGLEAYFVDDRTVREGKIERNHLTLLAQSDEGFKNLTKLSSAGFLEGLYRGKPGVDLHLLERHAEGVIALTGCLASRSSARIVEGRLPQARAHLDDLVQVFGPEDVYFEVQRNGIAEQEQVNEAIAKFAQEMGRPLVATADVHYLRKEDYHHHAALLCVQTKSTLAQPKMSLRLERVLLEELGGDGGVVRRHAGGARRHARDRRALRHDDRAQAAADPALRHAQRRVGGGLPPHARRPGPAQALRRPDPGAGPRARRHGARRHRQHGLQRLLPDRVGLRRLRQGERHRGRPGARLRGGQHRLLLPRHHRRRPAPLRPAVRALPQRRARVDAGHRHRLLRPRPRPRDPLRDREVRRGPRRPDHHLRPHVPARRHARRRARPRPRLRRRRPPRQAHPRPDHGPATLLRGLPAAGHRARRRGRQGPDRQADRRRRPRPRGHRPQRLDPRRRGRHLRPPADRHRPAPARRRRRGGGRREDLPHRHPVLDEADRGDRAAEDGLPRPAQPRRDRGRADHHRALDRCAHRHGGAAARRREDLRDDGPRRLGGRVPVRVRGHARGAQEGPARRVRGPRRAQRALPPGRHGPDPHLRPRQAQSRLDQLHRRPPAPDHRGHQGRDPVPGAVDADRQVDRRLLRPARGRPAEGDRQEEPRGDGAAEARVRGRMPRVRARARP